MPKLDLVSASSLKVSGGNVLKMKGVDFSWSPVRLADFYGTGPGQIAGDWRVDDPIYWPGTNYMQTARNDGGIGALIELGGSESYRPVTMSGAEGAKYAYATGGTFRTASFGPNNPDAAGVHSVIISRFGTGSYTFANPEYIGCSGVIVGTNETSGNVVVMGLTFPFVVTNHAFHVVEARYSTEGVTAYLDGVYLGTQPKVLESLLVTSLRMSAGWGFGRMISAVCDDVNHSATSLEPAVLLARQTLAEQYGVAL